MPFEPDKDKIVKFWKCDGTGLLISINQYNDGEAKLQIGPRVFVKKDGSESQRKAGRLTIEDVLWLYDVIDEIKEDLAKMAAPE
ncbi:MAG: hypothetical protein KKF30_15040 [Proteobacteria bacterium]|nr:hypothetical protein [Desulfobacteraceae bacterium]MBU4001496.1 hypothetical protein [Pseudomonadota bacterium]MBU4053983.1 hypothetical protein [Pseudomonadota bacterium]MBU4318575.1 hypothetical protein [Pseudomonadota bacterium]MBU4470402.1 hypothetical protein [Pseudomonadota bacterium]